jgi:hypothetical protein
VSFQVDVVVIPDGRAEPSRDDTIDGRRSEHPGWTRHVRRRRHVEMMFSEVLMRGEGRHGDERL